MKMNRRDFLKAAGLGAAALVMPSCISREQRITGRNPQSPNIVFIMADDLGYGDISCYNPESKISTPNIDSVALEGVRLTDAHSPSAVCTPTRYGVLTGRYCWRTWLKRGVLNGFSQPLIEKERLTVGRLLQRNGYRTACIGKWHLGVSWQVKSGGPTNDVGDAKRVDFTKPVTDGPKEHGFDYSFITAACSTVDPPYVFIENGSCTAQPTDWMENIGRETYFASRGGPKVPDWSNEDVDPTYVKKTREFLEQHKADHGDKQFFVYLALSAPHAPWVTPEFIRGLSDEGPRGDLVALVDWSVGQVKADLERLGFADNTILIFTSDNGPRIAGNGHKSAGKLRGYKSHIWEGGHQVPFVARWPGRIKTDTISDELVCLTDLIATCGAVVGTELPDDVGEDSFNVLPALLGKKSDKPIRSSMVNHSSMGVFCVRRGKWKLILDTKGSGGWVDPRDRKIKAGSPGQLYNLSEDPYEQNNLWDEHPEKVKELKQLLEKFKRQGHSHSV
jgi:arylsulfatase A-like enzyme